MKTEKSVHPSPVTLLTVVGFVLTCASAAAADAPARTDRARAADEYDLGSEALERGDFAAAAGHFEQAHRIQPSEVAREQAIRAYEQAGDRLRAANLALEAEGDHVALLSEVRAEAAQLSMRCEGCTLELDGEPQSERVVLVAAGSHQLRAHFAHGSVLRRFDAVAGGQVELAIEPPHELAPPPTAVIAPAVPAAAASPIRHDEPDGGLPPLATYALLGITAGAIGVTTWSALDMSAAGERYQRELDDAQRAPDQDSVARASQALERARSAESRTHVLIGASAALGAASALCALLWTDWGEHERPAAGPTLALSRRGAVAGWRQSW